MFWPDRPNDGISRTDSSTELRQTIRAFWQDGEQLWGEDLNQNFDKINTFSTYWVDQKGVPSGAWSTVLDDTEGIIRLGQANVMPFPGMVAFGVSDNTLYVWDGSMWRALANVDDYRPATININVSARDFRPGDDILVYNVTTPFTVPDDYLTAKGLHLGEYDPPNSGTHIEVYKNGTLVGRIGCVSDLQLAEWIPVSGAVDFASGDQLRFTVAGGVRYTIMSVTLIGVI